MGEFVTIDELLRLAEEEIPHPFVDFILGSAGSGQTFRRNWQAFERFAIEQQILIGHDSVDYSTDFLGAELAAPILVAPMGSMFKLHPDGDLEMARGVGRAGSMWAAPCMAGWTLEEIAEAATGPLLYQIYCDASFDRAEQQAQIARVEACPTYRGFVVTIDGGSKNRLERYLETRTFDDRSHYPGPRSPGHRFTWDDMDRLRSDVHLPMGLKGILNARDARSAVDHGADFVWVSNHGGRHLDTARATIDVLDEVAQEVGGEVPIVLDSGLRRGSDVVKALAKGASVVAFGKLAACALGVGGADGVVGLLDIVKAELGIALAMSGRASLDEVGPETIRPVDY